MEKRELTCIRCPIGCQLAVTVENGAVSAVTGNTCPRGAEYAAAEITNPMRMVTSIVKVNGGELPVVSVKTSCDIPKGGIFDCMEALRKIEVEAPVSIGDVIVKNPAGIGADIVATKGVAALNE